MRSAHQGPDQIYPQRQTRAADIGARRHARACECTRAHTLSKERRPLLMTDSQAKADHSEQEQVGRRTPVGCFPSPTPWVGFSHTCSAPSRLSQLPGIMTVLGLCQHLEQLPPGSQLRRDLGDYMVVRLFPIWGSWRRVECGGRRCTCLPMDPGET